MEWSARVGLLGVYAAARAEVCELERVVHDEDVLRLRDARKLYCIILCKCARAHYIVLYYVLQCCNATYRIVLYCIVLYYIHHRHHYIVSCYTASTIAAAIAAAAAAGAVAATCPHVGTDPHRRWATAICCRARSRARRGVRLRLCIVWHNMIMK